MTAPLLESWLETHPDRAALTDEPVIKTPHSEEPWLAPTIFQTREYLMAYRRCFGVGKEFHRLHAEGGTAYLMTRGRTAKRLEWWGAGIHDIGGAGYSCAATASALWERIEDCAMEHHATHLAQLPASCELVRLAARSGWRVTDGEACPVLALPPTWEAYVASLGKNMREQIKRYPKRLAKQYRVEYVLAKEPDEVQSALTDLFALHGKRWRARGQTGVLATPKRQAFHRAVCLALAERDRLRLWTLRCDDQPACVLLNYVFNGRYYFFIGGFDPDMMRLSVGTCLFARVFQQAIAEGAREFDFLRGEEEYKYRFGAINRPYRNLAFFRDSPRGKMMRSRLHLEHAVKQGVQRAFSAAHRKPNES